MPAPPKPPKRGPKPRKPIKRSGIERMVTQDMVRVGNSIGKTFDRMALDRMPKRRKRPNRIRQTENGKAKHKADLAWSKAVRAKGPCIAKNEDLFVVVAVDTRTGTVTLGPIHPPCGAITAAHVFSRRYLATRHDLDNGVPLCLFAHDFFTRHPDRWVEFISDYLGAEKYEALRRKAMAGPKAEA